MGNASAWTAKTASSSRSDGAARLGLALDTTYAVGEEAQLVAALVGHTGVVLVSWEHWAREREVVAARVPLTEARAELKLACRGQPCPLA